MRVIAGIYGSRKLRTLQGQALRPSSDRLRETLFNILGPAVKDALFVDLFAGSGAVGIEALSRGARRAIFVEKHAAGAALLRRNLESLGIATTSGGRDGRRDDGRAAHAGHAAHSVEFAGGAEIVTQDAVSALELLDRRGARADFVFTDPPYADDHAYEDVLSVLGDSDLLAPDGMAIFEHGRRRVLPVIAGSLERTRVLEQGDSTLTFYRVVRAA